MWVGRFAPFSSCWFALGLCVALMAVFLGCGVQCVLGWWALVSGFRGLVQVGLALRSLAGAVVV